MHQKIEELEDQIRLGFEQLGQFILDSHAMYLSDKAFIEEVIYEDTQPDFIVEQMN
jgi:hypothetical protein